MYLFLCNEPVFVRSVLLVEAIHLKYLFVLALVNYWMAVLACELLKIVYFEYLRLIVYSLCFSNWRLVFLKTFSIFKKVLLRVWQCWAWSVALELVCCYGALETWIVCFDSPTMILQKTTRPKLSCSDWVGLSIKEFTKFLKEMRQSWSALSYGFPTSFHSACLTGFGEERAQC